MSRGTIVVESLKASRVALSRSAAWATLVPAFDHAIVLAEEAEAQALAVSNATQVHVPPAYPALVLKLAAA